MPFETHIKRARFQSFGFTGQQMADVGSGLIQRGIIPRISEGLDVYDSPAPALAPSYALAKKRRGLSPVRNWMFTGRTLRSLKVITAQPNRAVIGFTDQETNRRAAINNIRARQFGVSSGRDTRILEAELSKLPPPIRAVQL